MTAPFPDYNARWFFRETVSAGATPLDRSSRLSVWHCTSALLARFAWKVADAAIDGIFGKANDGVVPTMGSYDLA